MTSTPRHFVRHALHSALFAAAGLYLAAASQAAPGAGSVEHLKTQAESRYEAEVKRCRSLSGQAEDVCKAQAKFERVSAVASAEARDKATPKAAHKAREEIAEARYGLDKERCRQQDAQSREVCLKDAKAAHVAAITNAEAAFKSGKAWENAAEDQAEAMQDAAEARCNTLDRELRAACRNQARAAGNPATPGMTALPPTAAGTTATVPATPARPGVQGTPPAPAVVVPAVPAAPGNPSR